MAIAKDSERGTRIAALREQAGYTQAALADVIGSHRRSVQNWEMGLPIEWANVVKLARALRSAPEVIVAGPVEEGEAGSPLELLEQRIVEIEGAIAERRQGDQLRGGFGQVAELISGVREEISGAREEVHGLRDRMQAQAEALEHLVPEVSALRRELAAIARSDTSEQRQTTREPKSRRD